MKKWLQSEELIELTAALILVYLLPYSLPWWGWFALFFAPDISFIAYAAGPRIGALVYNVFHHKGVCLLLAGMGIITANPLLISSGVLFYGHASFDRLLGYGLKYPDNFNHTHLS